MGTISRVTTWSTGDTLSASDLNGEFDNILSTANGSLNADNLGVTAGQASASKAIVLDSNKDFANATGSNQIRNLTLSGSLKIGTTFLPDASGGADLGSTSLEWGDVYVADDKYLYMGSDQNIKIGYDETTTDSLAISAIEGAGLAITLRADEGDDAGDEWKLNVADGGTITLGNDIASAGTFVTHLTLTPHATVSSSTLALAGALTVAGTAGITGVATVGGLTIGSAVINEAELETIDGITAGTVAASKAVVVDSNKDIGSFRNVTLTGELDAATGDFSGAVDIAGDLTLSAGADGALRFSAASSVKMLDNSAASLVFEEADDAYMTFVTTNSSEAVKFDKALDINAAMQIDSTITVGADDQGYDVKFFGDTASAYLLWDTSADKLLTAGGATIDIVKDKLLIGGTAVTTTAAELNTLDAVTAGTVAASKAVVVDSNKDIGTFRNITIDGTFSDGNYTFDTSGNVSGLGTIGSGAITATDTTAPLILKYDAGEYVTHAVSSAGVYSIATTDDSSDSGAITLDTVDSITLDSDTAGEGIVYADGGTNLLRVSNSSSDVIFKPLVDAKDLVFEQYDGNEVCRIADNRRLYFYDEGGEYISSSGSALTIASGSAAWELPAADGSDGQVLKTDGSGNLDWVSAASSSPAADDISTGDAAVSIATTTGNITIDAQANDADVIIKVDDGGSAVTALTLDGSDEGNAIFVNDVQLKSDSALLEFGADLDTSLTHTDGTGLTLNSTNKLTFGDTASFVQQSADGTLRIDGEAIIDLNASTRVDVSGDLKVGEEAFINASSNANTTKGLTISQGAENNTNASIALKQDNVAHGMTDLQETTTYLNICQWFTDIGGARLRAFSENEYAIELQGHYTTSNTTKTTAGVAAVSTYSAKKSGSTIGNNGANDNLFTIRGEEGTIRTRFLVDEDGDYHYDGADGGAFDDYSDAEMVRATAVALSDPSQIVRSKWDKLVRYQKDDLVEAGLIGAVTLEEEQEGHRGLVNGSQMQRLHTGAIWQLHCATQEIKEFYENKIAALESRLLRLEA